MPRAQPKKIKPIYIKVTVLPVDGDPYDELLPQKDFIVHAGAILKGYVAPTRSTRTENVVLLVDEDAAMKQLPRNAQASRHYIHTYIYGPALLLTQAEWQAALLD